jgi:hypothetical protein
MFCYQNKPWSAFYVACIFAMLISLIVSILSVIQQIGWVGCGTSSLELCKERFTTAYLPGFSNILLFLLASGFHTTIYLWIRVVATDKLITDRVI